MRVLVERCKDRIQRIRVHDIVQRFGLQCFSLATYSMAFDTASEIDSSWPMSNYV